MSRQEIALTENLQEVSATGVKGQIPQYSAVQILAVWAGAAVPMGLLAWVAAPGLAELLEGPAPFAQALFITMTVGLVWQFLLVVALVRREQGRLRWNLLRQALWLQSPRSPRGGRVGGRLWLVLIPLVVLYAAESMIPSLPYPAERDLGAFLGSEAGEAMFSGAWEWLGLLFVSMIFNTVLGEELLFRGFLLPRMNDAFGRADWLVNGVLFAAYHLHRPWGMPAILLDAVILSYPTKRYQSAWIGIAVHSTQTVLVAAIVLALVL